MPHQTSLLPRLPSTSCRESIYRELYIHSSDPVVASFLHWYVRTTFWDPIAKSKLNSSSLSLSLFSLSHLSFSLFNLIKRSFVVTPSLHPLLFSYLQKKKQEKKKDPLFFFGLLYRNCVRIYALFPVSWSWSSSNWESETFFLSGSDSVRYIIIPICSSFFISFLFLFLFLTVQEIWGRGRERTLVGFVGTTTSTRKGRFVGSVGIGFPILRRNLRSKWALFLRRSCRNSSFWVATTTPLAPSFSRLRESLVF